MVGSDESRKKGQKKLRELNNFKELNKVRGLFEKIVAQETGVDRPGCVTVVASGDPDQSVAKDDIKMSVIDTKDNLKKINNRFREEFGKDKGFYSKVSPIGKLWEKDRVHHIEIDAMFFKKASHFARLQTLVWKKEPSKFGGLDK